MNGGMGNDEWRDGERGKRGRDRSMESGEIIATLFQKDCFSVCFYRESSVDKRYGDENTPPEPLGGSSNSNRLPLELAWSL